MKCSGKHDTTVHEIFCVVSRFPRYNSCYIAENQFPKGQCYADPKLCTTVCSFGFVFTFLSLIISAPVLAPTPPAPAWPYIVTFKFFLLTTIRLYFKSYKTLNNFKTG